MFCLTSLQIAFLRPYLSLVPNNVSAHVWKGDWTNVLSPILCVATLVLALLAARRMPMRATIPEIVISAALVILAAVTSISSPSPDVSSMKAFALVAPSLAGFWCARLVLNSQYRLNAFTWVSAASLLGVVALVFFGLASYHTTYKLLYSNYHPVVTVLALLLFAPLALLSWEKNRHLS